MKESLVYVIAIAVLFVVLMFKNKRIDNLEAKLAEKPTIEYLYRDKPFVVKDSIPYPVERIEYKEKIMVEHDTVKVELNKADSAMISRAYAKMYNDFNATNVYNDTIRDDSLAFISIEEKVNRNQLFDRKVTFVDRTPIVYRDNVINKQRISLVGGLSADVETSLSFSLNAGLVTPTNKVFAVSYDPFTQTYRGTVMIPIFSFRK